MHKTKRRGLYSWVRRIPWRRATHLVFLSEESRGQRSLADYSPQGHKESDTTEGTEHRLCSEVGFVVGREQGDTTAGGGQDQRLQDAPMRTRLEDVQEAWRAPTSNHCC